MVSVLGENIGRIMNLKNITQEELKKKSGISRPTISKVLEMDVIESRSVKISTIIELAKALNVDFPSLFSRRTNEQLINGDKYLEDDYVSVFVQNVKRKNMGKKQKLLSTEPGVKESTISALFNSKINDPYLSSLQSIAEVLDISLESLFKRGGK